MPKAGSRMLAWALLVVPLVNVQSVGMASAIEAPAVDATSPSLALDTTGISGSRPGCLPHIGQGSAPSPGDVRPDDAASISPIPAVRPPKIVDDHAVVGGVDRGAGENRSLPRGATGSPKANDC